MAGRTREFPVIVTQPWHDSRSLFLQVLYFLTLSDTSNFNIASTLTFRLFPLIVPFYRILLTQIELNK